MEFITSDLGHVIWGALLHTFGAILSHIALKIWEYLTPKLKSYHSRRYDHWRNKRISSDAPGGRNQHANLALRQSLGKKIRSKKQGWTRLKPLQKKPVTDPGEFRLPKGNA